MSKVKKLIFWLTFIPMCVLMILIGLVMSVGEALEDCINRWEGWCMEYEKNGWTRTSGGIWIKKYVAQETQD